MSQNFINVTLNGTYLVGNLVKKRDSNNFAMTCWVEGTFGSGTIAWRLSRNSGTTTIPLSDYNGAAITSTAAGAFNSQPCTGNNNNDRVQLYVILTGATSPSLTVGFIDNNH